jgi:hypothetical protein
MITRNFGSRYPRIGLVISFEKHGDGCWWVRGRAKRVGRG